MIKKTLKVDGMTCAMCAKTISNTFASLDGISAKVNVSAGKVIFTYDENIWNMRKIGNMVKHAGYIPVYPDDLLESVRRTKRQKIKILISSILTIPLLWTMWHHLGIQSVYVPMIFMEPWFQFMLATPVQFIIGFTFYKATYKSAKQLVFGMDALVVMGTSAAYFYSVYQWILLSLGEISEASLYFETSATIITIILVGHYVEHLAKSRTESALIDLVNLGAKDAKVLVDGIEVSVPIEEVNVNDIIIVLAGEKIPVDGLVVKGASYVDESMINGESIPNFKESGSKVIGATINQDSKLTIKALKVGSDTVLASIIETVEDASASKPPIQRTADKIATIFVPIVLSISILTFIVWYYIIGKEFLFAFEASIAVLVISCPCALGLATPTSVLVGSGVSAKAGILYKGGEFFEIAHKINAIAFDKTGTLTEGKPSVVRYEGSNTILDYIYTLEKESNHPLSKAITTYTEEQGAKVLEISNFESLTGKGVKADIDGKTIYVGSNKLIKDLDIQTNRFDDLYNTYTKEGITSVFVIVDGEVLSLIGIRDKIKSTTVDVLKELKKRNIEAYMITGDNKLVASVIVKELGITNYYAEVLPKEKADIVKEIQAKGKIVAFVGDGINDAPALKQADIGIAMGDGSDIAIDTSDVTLMKQDLGLVIKAIDMSKATLRNIYQNFFWAFSYNIVAIPLAASGLLSPMVAGFAMAFSDITVVGNALRLKRYKLPEFKESGGDNMKFNVTNMTCGHCEMTIRKSLKENGFEDVNVDLLSRTVEVNIEGRKKEEVIEAITTVGYDVK
ncbi:MAG: heavy metal translocating P-type ATPase [Candidatus Izemoplasma sp.]